MIDMKELASALAYEYLGDEEQYLQDILEDPKHVGLLYTTFDGEEHEHDIQIELDLIGMLTHVYVDGELAYTEPFTEEDYESIVDDSDWFNVWYSYMLDRVATGD